jgi:hypothetical protein
MFPLSSSTGEDSVYAARVQAPAFRAVRIQCVEISIRRGEINRAVGELMAGDEMISPCMR